MDQRRCLLAMQVLALEPGQGDDLQALWPTRSTETKGDRLKVWLSTAPDTIAPKQDALVMGFDETATQTGSLNQLTADYYEAERGMIVTDPEACPMCGMNGTLSERHCEVFCRNCHAMIQSCSDV